MADETAVVGGVDTHTDSHQAAVIDSIGRHLASGSTGSPQLGRTGLDGRDVPVRGAPGQDSTAESVLSLAASASGPPPVRASGSA